VATIQLHPILVKLFAYHIGAGTNPASSSESMETLPVQCFPCGAWKWGDGFIPSLIEFPNADVEEYWTQYELQEAKLLTTYKEFDAAMKELVANTISKYKDLQTENCHAPACHGGIDHNNAMLLVNDFMMHCQEIFVISRYWLFGYPMDTHELTLQSSNLSPVQ
jgi:hypothetical protein